VASKDDQPVAAAKELSDLVRKIEKRKERSDLSLRTFAP